MTAVFVRILLRYGAGALVGLLVAKGFLPAGTNLDLSTDPDVVAAVAVIFAAVAEGWHVLARKMGWTT